MVTLQVSHVLFVSSSSSSSSSPCPVTLSFCKSMAFIAKFSRHATLSLSTGGGGLPELLGLDRKIQKCALMPLKIHQRIPSWSKQTHKTSIMSAKSKEKNRDMIFSEVKLTVMIEDPREVQRRRLLGIEDPDAPTREDLVEALEQVNEGKVPKNGLALRMVAEEMINWPNFEVEAPKKKLATSLYAKATDTGIDPKEAAKRLNIDWDSGAEIEEAEVNDETEAPPAVGYGALYLVTAFPVIIGISVVLILFYNSLQ